MHFRVLGDAIFVSEADKLVKGMQELLSDERISKSDLITTGMDILIPENDFNLASLMPLGSVFGKIILEI